MYDLMNPQRPAPDLMTGGQPSEADLRTLAAGGLARVVDLRMPGEHTAFDEAALCAELGVSRVVVAVNGPGGLTRANADAMVAAAAEAGGPVLVHCGSGNRVGGLYALHAAWTLGLPVDDAIAYGRARGLTALEPRVRQLLQAG